MSYIVSAMGSRARAYNDCIARSYIVGIPKGRFFFLPGLLMKTLLNGLALYLLPVRLQNHAHLALSYCEAKSVRLKYGNLGATLPFGLQVRKS
jgi:hypothetical protein